MKTAVIDLDSIIFTAFHPNKIIDEFGNPKRTEDGKRFLYQEKTITEIVDSCNYLITTILNETNSDTYIAYVKGHQTTKNRLALNPDYKGNRSKESPKFWNFCKSYYIDVWKAVEVNNIEVDDAVSLTYNSIPNSFICAIDKDLLSLATTSNMQHYNWRTKEYISVSHFEARKKFWTDMIVGQPGDNIKGLPGKGEKFVEELFKNLVDGTVNDLMCLRVLRSYIAHYPTEDKGISEFFKNYNSLKILTDINSVDFIVPEPILYKKPEKDLSEDIPTF